MSEGAPHIQVRQASVDDLDLLTPLFDAYRVFYRRPSDPSLARAFLLDRFRHQQSVVFLATGADGDGLGFAQLYPSFSSVSAARIFVLNDLFVSPKARSAGVGGRLLEAAAEYGRAVGAVRLTLSTAVDNETAQGLYEARGWVRDTAFFHYDLAL